MLNLPVGGCVLGEKSTMQLEFAQSLKAVRRERFTDRSSLDLEHLAHDEVPLVRKCLLDVGEGAPLGAHIVLI